MKNRKLKGILFVLCLMAAMLFATVTVSAAGYKYQTTANLRMRKSSVNGKTITTVPKGAVVTITKKSKSHPTWYYGTYTNSKKKTYTGFMSSKYLKAYKEDSTKVGSTQTTAIQINLRKAAKVATDNVVQVLKAGTKVKILKKSGTAWLYVQTSAGKKGYVQVGFFRNDLSNKKIYKIVKADVNFRSSKKIAKNNVIAVVKKGKKVQVLSESGSWFNVVYNNKKGYLKSGYFKGTEKDKSTTVTETLSMAVNLRSEPNKDKGVKNVIAVLSKGTVVQVLKEYSANWLQVKVPSTGKTGYISTGYFKSDTAASKTTRVTTAALRIHRSMKKTTSNVASVTSKGDEVTVLKTYSGWYKVSYTDHGKTTVGYVVKGYFK